MEFPVLRAIFAATVTLLFLLQSAQAQRPPASGTGAMMIPKGVKFLTPLIPYPRVARDKHIEGSGVLEVSFDAAGAATKAVMVKSTGNAWLDQAATSYAKANWRSLTGKPEVHQTPVNFRLQ